MSADQANNMEEILSTIRTTLAEETAKVGSGEAGGDLSDEEVLALSEAEMVPLPETRETGSVAAGSAEEMIDLNTFAASGEMVSSHAATVPAEDVLGLSLDDEAPEQAPLEAEGQMKPAEDVVEPVASGDADAVDDLMTQIKQQSLVPADVRNEVLLEGLDEVAAAEVRPALVSAMATTATPTRLALDTVAGKSGLEVALPAEVLAQALRPLVQGWLRENLPAVVERLVQAEIAKLTRA